MFINTDVDTGIGRFNYIKNWYTSVLNNNMNCIIFYDNLSPEFIKRFSYENKDYLVNTVEFIKIEHKALHVIDYRWVIYSEFLKTNRERITNVLFTDIADVIILKNPFEFMSEKKNVLFLGDEETNVGNPWVVKRNVFLRKVLPDIENYEKLCWNKKLLNCGIVGGNVDIVFELVSQMADILLMSNLESTTFDMSVLNYLVYTKYSDRFFSGNPLNTRFKFYETNNNNYYIAHK